MLSCACSAVAEGEVWVSVRPGFTHQPAQEEGAGLDPRCTEGLILLLPSLPTDPSPGCTDCSRIHVTAAAWAYFGTQWVGSWLALLPCRQGGSPPPAWLPAPCSSIGLAPSCGVMGRASPPSSSVPQGGQHRARAWVGSEWLRGCVPPQIGAVATATPDLSSW